MDKILKQNLMLDFYGNLLTDKQKEIMTMYYNVDSGLSEIAEQMGMTRQAVYDSVKVSENILNSYEDKLNLVQKYLLNRELIIENIDILNSEKNYAENKKLQKVKKNLEKLLQNM